MDHRGTVKQFFPTPDRRYGFIKADGKKDVFFHLKDGRSLYIEGLPGLLSVVPSDVSAARMPAEGDVLVYNAIPADVAVGGMVAEVWAFASEYDRLIIEIGQRVYYRVTKVVVSRKAGRPDATKSVVWMGHSLEQLTRFYPVGALRSTESVRFTFQVTNEAAGGEWINCEDPRPGRAKVESAAA